jgi:hypothetical protein
MVFAGSVIGILLILGYCVSRVKAKLEAKKNMQTLFNTKWDILEYVHKADHVSPEQDAR